MRIGRCTVALHQTARYITHAVYFAPATAVYSCLLRYVRMTAERVSLVPITRLSVRWRPRLARPFFSHVSRRLPLKISMSRD